MRSGLLLALTAMILLAAGGRADAQAWAPASKRKAVSAAAVKATAFGHYASIEETQATNAEREACLKEARTVDWCLDVILRLPPSSVDASAEDRALMERTFALVERLYPVDPEVLALVRDRPTGDLAQGVLAWDAAAGLAESWYGTYSAEWLRLTVASENAAWRVTDGLGGGSILIGYLEALEQKFGPDSLEVATVLNAYAGRQAASPLGVAEDVLAMLRRAVEIRRKRLGEDHRSTAISKANLGHALAGLGRYREAEPWLREAKTALGLSPGERRSARAVTARLADALYGQGRRVEAEALQRDVLAAFAADLQADRRERSAALQALARSVADAGRQAEAEALLTEALALEMAIAAEPPPVDPGRLVTASQDMLYELMPQWRESALAFARQQEKEAAGRRLASLHVRLARARFAQADYPAAAARAEQAEAAFPTAEAKLVLAGARLSQGKTDEVEYLLLSAEDRSLPADHPLNVERMSLLAVYHLLWSPSHAPGHMRQATDAVLGRANGARTAPGAVREELDQHRELFRAQVALNWLVADRAAR
ncbi:MAG TPA: tetratricopeptide repeat protein [Caulobacteraceae bacterium]|nr:tetratricopeptide repeat protein [Caulobacteraceae bacterium]